MDLRARTRRGWAAAAAAAEDRPRSRTWRVLRIRSTSSRRDLRLALATWVVIGILGIGGIISLSRWGIAVGVIAVLLAGRQLVRVVGWLARSRK